MKRLFYIAAAATAVLSACTKEDPIVEVGTEPESVSMPVFKATIEGPDTKTTLGEGYKVNWENGDEVYLQYAPAVRFVAFNHPTLGPQYAWRQNGETSIGIFDVTPNGSDPSRGTFNLSDQILDGGKSPGEGEKWMLWATYPASLRNRVTGELSFPSTQIFKDNDISFAPMFCGGVLEDEFVMKNIAAILSVTVPSSAFSSVQSIVVSSDQWMNGACELGTDSNWDMVLAKHTNTSTYGNQDDPANKSITLVCNSTGSDTEIPNDGSKTFYISIPVNHYDYLQIDVTDGTTTKSMRTNNPSGIQVERNRIYPITFAENYIAPAAWETALTLGRNDYNGPTSIAIQTGVNISSYTEDATHKSLNAAGTLWEVLDGQVLRIQTSSNKIIAPVNSSLLFGNYLKVESITGLDKLDMSAVTNIEGMFMYCHELRSLNLSSFNTSNVTDMNRMFFYCYNLTEIIGIENFNTSNVTNMSEMFGGCSGLTALNISNFVTSNVENMSGMFANCSGVTELNISNFVTSNVEDMASMFDGCQVLQELNLSNFNTENVTDMSYMFASCQALQALNLSSFNTENVTNMNSMFLDCQALQTLDLSSFHTMNVIFMSQMFFNCSSLQSLTLGDFFEPGSEMNEMFAGCSSELWVFGANDRFVNIITNTWEAGWEDWHMHFDGYY